MAKTRLLGISIWNFRAFEELTLGRTFSGVKIPGDDDGGDDPVGLADPISNYLAVQGGINTGKSNLVAAFRLIAGIHTSLQEPVELGPDAMLDKGKPMGFEVHYQVTETEFDVVADDVVEIVKPFTYRVVYSHDDLSRCLIKDYEALIAHRSGKVASGDDDVETVPVDVLIMLATPGRAFILHELANAPIITNVRFDDFGNPLILMNKVNGASALTVLNSITGLAFTHNICNVINRGAHIDFQLLREFMAGIGFLTINTGQVNQQIHQDRLHRHVNATATNLLPVILFLRREHSALWLEVRTELQKEIPGFHDVGQRVIRFPSGFPTAMEMLLIERWPLLDEDGLVEGHRDFRTNRLSDGTATRMAYKLITKNPNPLRLWIVDIMEAGLSDAKEEVFQVIDQVKAWVEEIDGNVIATTNSAIIANAIGDNVTFVRTNGITEIEI